MATSASFCVYELPRVLYVAQRLVLNPVERILTLMSNDELEAQCLLTEQEIRVLLAFLRAFPHSCSYIALYAAVTEMAPERIELFFGHLDDAPALAAEVARPILQRCRALLDTFNIGIRPIEDVGYELFRL